MTRSYPVRAAGQCPRCQGRQALILERETRRRNVTQLARHVGQQPANYSAEAVRQAAAVLQWEGTRSYVSRPQGCVAVYACMNGHRTYLNDLSVFDDDPVRVPERSWAARGPVVVMLTPELRRTLQRRRSEALVEL